MVKMLVGRGDSPGGTASIHALESGVCIRFSACFPKKKRFLSCSSKQPINVIEGSRLLKELMEDYTNVQQKTRRIKDVEHVGDGITHDIALRLNQTFLTPFDREDIHDLASALDDILDAVEVKAVADRFIIYKIA
jgi:hypothetical protein